MTDKMMMLVCPCKQNKLLKAQQLDKARPLIHYGPYDHYNYD